MFEPEPICWRSFTDYANAQLTLKPDAFISIASGEVEQVSFVEVDLATEHTPTLRRKLGRYLTAFDAGVEQPGDAAFPNVLWAVPSQKRADQLQRLIEDLPPEQAALFGVVLSESASELAVLAHGNSP